MYENFWNRFFHESIFSSYSVGWWIATTSVWPLRCIVLFPVTPENPPEDRCAGGRMPQIPIMPCWSKSRFLAPDEKLAVTRLLEICHLFLTLKILHRVIAIIFLFLVKNKHRGSLCGAVMAGRISFNTCVWICGSGVCTSSHKIYICFKRWRWKVADFCLIRGEIPEAVVADVRKDFIYKCF